MQPSVQSGQLAPLPEDPLQVPGALLVQYLPVDGVAGVARAGDLPPLVAHHVTVLEEDPGVVRLPHPAERHVQLAMYEEGGVQVNPCPLQCLAVQLKEDRWQDLSPPARCSQTIRCCLAMLGQQYKNMPQEIAQVCCTSGG